MKELLKSVSHCLLIILVVMVVVQYCTNKSLKEDNARLQQNEVALSQKMKTWQYKEGSYIAQVQSLQVGKDELMQIASEEAEEVKALQIKLKRLQSYSESGLLSEYHVDTIRVYDSIFIRDSIIDTMQCIDYADDWFQMYGCIEDNRYTGEIYCFDTLIQVVERIPKKFLFFKYGTKGFQQTIKSKNPHSRIVYSKSILLK